MRDWSSDVCSSDLPAPDSSLHVDTGAKNLAQELLFGSPVHWTFPDLEECDFLILLGANPMVSHMSIISEPRALHKLQAIHERSEEHTSELQSLMRISYAVLCLKKKKDCLIIS